MSTPDTTPPPHKKMGMFHDPIPPSVFEPVSDAAEPQKSVVMENHRNLVDEFDHASEPECIISPKDRAYLEQLFANSEVAAVAEATKEWLECAQRVGAKMLHEQADHNKTVDKLIAANAQLTEAQAALARSEAECGKKEAYIKKLDGLLEEVGGCAVSCINPYEDLKRALTGLKVQVTMAIEERDFSRQYHDVTRKELTAAQSELARVSAERDAANDALRSARTELGSEDGPFICDQIKRIKAERDTLREQVSHFKSGRVWNIANEELDKLREHVRILRTPLIEVSADFSKHGESMANYSDGEYTQDYTTRSQRINSAISATTPIFTSPTAAQTKEGV